MRYIGSSLRLRVEANWHGNESFSIVRLKSKTHNSLPSLPSPSSPPLLPSSTHSTPLKAPENENVCHRKYSSTLSHRQAGDAGDNRRPHHIPLHIILCERNGATAIGAALSDAIGDIRIIASGHK